MSIRSVLTHRIPKVDNLNAHVIFGSIRFYRLSENKLFRHFSNIFEHVTRNSAGDEGLSGLFRETLNLFVGGRVNTWLLAELFNKRIVHLIGGRFFWGHVVVGRGTAAISKYIFNYNIIPVFFLI
jgi:hypothetical protein